MVSNGRTESTHKIGSLFHHTADPNVRPGPCDDDDCDDDDDAGGSAVGVACPRPPSAATSSHVTPVHAPAARCHRRSALR